MRRVIHRLWLVIWLLLLVACQQVETRSVSTSEVVSVVETPLSTPTLFATPTLSPSPTGQGKVTLKPSPVEPADSVRGVVPVVGGLATPEEVPWYLPHSQDPLAYLLAQYLHRSLFDPLTGTPDLVAEWSLEDEQATFRLQPDAAWSDGLPLRAADVVDILLQAKETGELVGLRGARVMDFNTFQLTLDSPACSALIHVTSWPIVDVREWPPLRNSNAVKVSRKGADWWRIEETALSADLLFEYRTYPDELALRAAYQEGEINSVLGASRLKMGPLKGAQEASEHSGPLLASLMFRVDEPLIKEVKVREALTLATDRDALFKSAYGTNAPPLLTALLPASHWAAPFPMGAMERGGAPAEHEKGTRRGSGGSEGGMAFGVGANEPGRDLERAQTLLFQAGWQELNDEGVRLNAKGDPLELILTLPLSPDQRWESLGKELARQWREIGVDLTPFYVAPYFLQERLHTKRWQIALLAFIVSPEPAQQALWGKAAPDDILGQDMNITGYQNAAVVELMKQGTQVPGCAPQKRAAFYHSAYEQLLTDRPLWPLFALPLDEVHRPDVEWLP